MGKIMARTDRLVRTPENFHKQLEQLAKDTGKPKSQILRELGYLDIDAIYYTAAAGKARITERTNNEPRPSLCSPQS